MPYALISKHFTKIFITLTLIIIPFTTTNADTFSLGKIQKILGEETRENAFTGEDEIIQKVQVKPSNQDKPVTFEHSGVKSFQNRHTVKEGETVILKDATQNPNEPNIYIADKLRLPQVIILFFILFAIVIYFTKWRGLTSILGLLASLAILAFFVAPQILAGKDPLTISFIGACIISLISIYLAHGITLKTSIALFGTIITIFFALALSIAYVKFAKLSGMGSENAFYLQLGTNININLQGLLLGGVIIGTLGILDDVTTTQATAIYELKKANNKYNFKDLYQAGIRIGQEHILSLINTLTLAYAGASFPLFLSLTIDDHQPLWIALNSEFISEEIVRTLIGSMALIFAIPITSLLAAWVFSKYKNVIPIKERHLERS